MLADGARASALNVYTYVDADTFRWQSIDREIAGELQPNIPEVTVVRQKKENGLAAEREGGIPMRRYTLILTASVLSVALIADASFAQRGGRGGGGGGAAGGASLRQSLAVDEPTQYAFRQPTIHAELVLRPGKPRPHAPGPEPARVPRLRAPARAPASTAVRSRAASAPEPDNGLRCLTGSHREPHSRPAPAPRHQPPVNSLPDPEEAEGAGRPGAGGPGRPGGPEAKPPVAKPPVAKPPGARKPTAGAKPPVTKPPIAGSRRAPGRQLQASPSGHPESGPLCVLP